MPPDENGTTVSGDSTFNVSLETSSCLLNSENASAGTETANVVYALCFKGTDQYAVGRYEIYTLQANEEKTGFGLNCLRIQIKALDADDETPTIDDIVASGYWARDYIEVIIPCAGYQYSNAWVGIYGNDCLLMSSTLVWNYSNYLVTSIVIQDLHVITDATYGETYGISVCLIQCDENGDIL